MKKAALAISIVALAIAAINMACSLLFFLWREGIIPRKKYYE